MSDGGMPTTDIGAPDVTLTDTVEAPVRFVFERPDNTPRGLAVVYLILCFSPCILLMFQFYKRKMAYEMMITLAVFIFGSIQSVMEVLDKSRCWDDIQLCPPSAYSDERGTPVLSFDWTQLADTRLIGLDFLDWHKLMARSAILLCCLIIFNTMQNIDREFDRMLAALFTIGVLIITEWGTLHHISFVDIALLPITSAFFITFAKATECFRGKRRDIKTQDLIRAIVFLTIAGVFFLFQFRGEARKSSLMRPFYGLYCFNAAIGAIFVIRAFTERGTIPQFVGLHTNNNDINGRPLERPITGARRGNTAVLY